ncbi:hypothetical protein F5B21DRAFT_507596 [Xylaria acuta]|nr:hypothetical protein F5B21DRAFT_507596 [Xylaria acuta]
MHRSGSDPTTSRKSQRFHFAIAREGFEMTPLYLCASNMNAVAASSAAAAADTSTSTTMSSAPISDSTTRRPSNVIMHPPRPKKKKAHSTDPYLRDFTLVAEAARRAQMSIMIRDMENVGISS